MNNFTETQLEVIRDLAECYWETNQRGHYENLGGDEKILLSIKADYVEEIIKGLEDSAVWD